MNDSHPSTDATRPTRSWWYYSCFFAGPLLTILVLDLVTKAAVFSSDGLAAARLDYQGHAWIRPSINTGAAWGIGHQLPWLIGILTLVLVPALAVAWWRWFRGASRLEDLAFGCVLGGALGNLVDRLAAMLPAGGYGGVRDFIHVDLDLIGIDYVWPTFNIADVGISIGAVAFVLTTLIGPRKAGAPDADPEHP